VAAALAQVGLSAEAAVFDEEWADDFLQQLRRVQAALVWIDPVSGDRDRHHLDALLRQAAAAGVLVSAHPDVILKMGTKEVLYQTRHLGWGSDVHLYRSLTEFWAEFPGRLWASGPRVLKQYRGNGGIGVWKVELAEEAGGADPGTSSSVLIQSARSRDDKLEHMPLGDFMARCAKYFAYADGEGRLIDQAFQARISEGLIRCYLVRGEVVGFARQYPAASTQAGSESQRDRPPPGPARVFGLPSAKTMFGPNEAAFAGLRQQLEQEWVPGMQARLDLDDASLPMLWDADFLLGPTDTSGTDSHVLSEINVSAVAPFPEQALPKLADALRRALQ
jgi:hypothetical protein